MGAGFFALFKFFNSNFNITWLGVAISGIAVFLFFMMLFGKNTARTNSNLPVMTSIVAFGAFLTIGSGIVQPLSDYGIQILLVLVNMAGWLLYVYWYSYLGNRNSELLKPGQKLPSFSAEDKNGNSISSKSFIGSPSLILFYRGNWCPLCMAQIKEIAALYNVMINKGVKVILISPQSQQKTRELALKLNVPFTFLKDVDNEAAKKLKILHKNGLPAGMQMMGYESDTVLPTVIITDSTGKIVYCDLTDNYRIRPEPETFIRIIDSQLMPA